VATPAPLTTRGLNRATLARQGLLDPIRAASAAEAVRRLASLQAQHPEWPPIALASRAADQETADLAGALDRREVVRSSLMRITIHVVVADDLWPMFVLTRPLRLAQWALLTKVDPATSELGSRLTAAHATAVSALREQPMSSLEVDRLLSREIGLDHASFTRPAWREPETRVPVRVAWRHLAAHVPLVHVPHAEEGYGRSRYAIASDWLGTEPPELDEAAARTLLARRYLAAFGPASIADLTAYVGRGRGGIGPWKAAIAALGDEIVWLRADDGRELVDLADAPRPSADAPAAPRILARWDSVLLSHEAKRRQRVIADEHRSAVFTKNADVRPTFLVDGMVAGTWDLARADGAATATLRPFTSLPKRMAELLAAEAERVLGLVAPGADRRIVDVMS
jgi:hypothetical protein